MLLDVACDMHNLPCRGTRVDDPPASTRSNMLNMQDGIVEQDICSITEDGSGIWYLSRAGEGKKGRKNNRNRSEEVEPNSISRCSG